MEENRLDILSKSAILPLCISPSPQTKEVTLNGKEQVKTTTVLISLHTLPDTKEVFYKKLSEVQNGHSISN